MQRLSTLTRVSHVISMINRKLGQATAWCSLFLVILVFVIATMRYLFHVGSIPMQELVIYLHGILFMLGIGYTLTEDEHVRVDVFYAGMTPGRKAWINLLGSLCLLLPMAWFLFSYSLDYVLLSWRIKEASSEAGGLPALYLLKSLLLIMPALVALQGLAIILDSVNCLVAGDD